MTCAPRTICILEGAVDVTGSFICLRNMAKLYADRIRFVLILPAESAISGDYLSPFYRVYKIPITPLSKNLRSVTHYVPSLLSAIIRIRSILHRHRCNHFQVNDFYLAQGYLVRSLGYSGKIVTWVRINPSKFGGIASKIWLELAKRNSDRLVAVSKHIANCLPEGFKTEILYDPVFDAPERDKPTSVAGSQSIIFIGNYICGKGQNIALDAFQQISEQFPTVKLRFFGSDMGLEKNKRYKRDLENQAEKLGCSAVVEFNSFTKNAKSELLNSDIALNLSESESFSLTCLEASMAGLPTIATKCGGPEEIIVHGETGYLVPINSSAHVAEYLAHLLGDAVDAQKMGRAAKRHVEQLFSAEQFELGYDALWV